MGTIFLHEAFPSRDVKIHIRKGFVQRKMNFEKNTTPSVIPKSNKKFKQIFFETKNGEPLKSWHRVYHIFEKWYWKWPLISKVLFFSLSPFRNRAKHPRKLFLKRKEKQFFIKLIYGFLVCWCVWVSVCRIKHFSLKRFGTKDYFEILK